MSRATPTAASSSGVTTAPATTGVSAAQNMATEPPATTTRTAVGAPSVGINPTTTAPTTGAPILPNSTAPNTGAVHTSNGAATVSASSFLAAHQQQQQQWQTVAAYGAPSPAAVTAATAAVLQAASVGAHPGVTQAQYHPHDAAALGAVQQQMAYIQFIQAQAAAAAQAGQIVDRKATTTAPTAAGVPTTIAGSPLAFLDPASAAVLKAYQFATPLSQPSPPQAAPAATATTTTTSPATSLGTSSSFSSPTLLVFSSCIPESVRSFVRSLTSVDSVVHRQDDTDCMGLPFFRLLFAISFVQ